MNKEKLSEFEWDLTWMSIRYAMNRQTIASTTLPQRIIKYYYSRFTENQKESIVRDLKENFEEYNIFGNEIIDHPKWMKFWYALDKSKHKEVVDIKGVKYIIFELFDKVYPLDKYLKEPHLEIYLPKENIKK